MPLYSYKCPNCGREFELYNSVQNRDFATCGICGTESRKILSPISKPVVMEYYSENLGAYVTGPRQKQRLMKERNVKEVA